MLDRVQDLVQAHGPGNRGVAPHEHGQAREQELHADQERGEEQPEPEDRVDREGGVLVLMLLDDRIAVEHVAIRSRRDGLEPDRREPVVVTMPVGEPAQPRHRHRVEHVAVEGPLEEAQDQVHAEEGEQEGEAP